MMNAILHVVSNSIVVNYSSKKNYFSGSCWAVSSATVMTDAICSRHYKRYNPNMEISAKFALDCCEFCGNKYHGASPYQAYWFFNRNGTVYGSYDYVSMKTIQNNLFQHTGCYPYLGLNNYMSTCPKDPKCHLDNSCSFSPYPI